jgi:Protein of unknown function (DUF732)
MSSHRWFTRLTIPLIISAALTTGTAVATADSSDDAYLSKLKNLGFTWQSGADSDIIGMGHSICSDRLAGKTPDAIAADLHGQLSSKGYSFADITGMVSAAESVYCPG